MDMTHVLACLNKLDAGTNERIMLVSRDEQSCLVVSYREVKACVESAFTCVSFSLSLAFVFAEVRGLVIFCFPSELVRA